MANLSITSVASIAVYGLLLLIATALLFAMRAWTKLVIIGLILAWLPFVVWSTLWVLMVVTAVGHLRSALMVSLPIVVILIGIILVGYFVGRSRG